MDVKFLSPTEVLWPTGGARGGLPLGRSLLRVFSLRLLRGWSYSLEARCFIRFGGRPRCLLSSCPLGIRVGSTIVDVPSPGSVVTGKGSSSFWDGGDSTLSSWTSVMEPICAQMEKLLKISVSDGLVNNGADVPVSGVPALSGNAWEGELRISTPASGTASFPP